MKPPRITPAEAALIEQAMATPKMRRPKVARDQWGFPLDAKLIGVPYRPKPAPAAAKKMLRKASHAGAAV